MSLWPAYGLLGAVAGPAVMAYARLVTHGEPLSWATLTIPGWMPASAFLATLLSLVAIQETPTTAGAISWLAIIGLLLALIDSTSRRLPHPIVGTLLVGGVVQLGFVAIVQSDLTPLVRAAIASAAVFAVGLALYFETRSLGFGDVTLAATITVFLGWFGWLPVFLGLAVALSTAAAVSLARLAARSTQADDRVALGPALIAGAVCTILLI